jgi:hypothetical protein
VCHNDIVMRAGRRRRTDVSMYSRGLKRSGSKSEIRNQIRIEIDTPGGGLPVHEEFHPIAFNFRGLYKQKLQ